MAEDKSKSEIAATEEDDEESEEVLIPKSFFAGKDLEIGSTCKIKIEALYEDEVSASYVPHKSKDKDKDKDKDDDSHKPHRDSMDGAMREMDTMAGPPPSMGGY